MGIEGDINCIVDGLYIEHGTTSWRGTEYYTDRLLKLFKEHAEWYIGEITRLQQENEELDIDLMLSKSRFVNLDQLDVTITKKRRSNF